MSQIIRTITTEWHPESDPAAIESRMADWCRWMEANSMPWGLTSATTGSRWAGFTEDELKEIERWFGYRRIPADLRELADADALADEIHDEIQRRMSGPA